MTGGETAK